MKKYNLYVSTYSPNGTQMLFITDCDNQIVETIDEAVFGLNINFEDYLGNTNWVFYDESVTFVAHDEEALEWDGEQQIEVVHPDKTASELYEEMGFTQVAKTSINEVLEHIAISPISDGTKTLKILNKYFKIEEVVA